jgi:glycosyltransferase involved in cell wall biosynthesis/nucleotide-binding universal stress UspA family protein
MAKLPQKIMFRKILVPVLYGFSCEAAQALARLVDRQGQVILAGMVHIPEEESLSTAALTARKLRKRMRSMAADERIHIREKVQVSHRPWEDLVKVVEEEHADLLVLEWPCQFTALQTTPGEVLAYPPCDVAIVSGSLPSRLEDILVPLRGGPYAELALRLSLSIGRTCQADVTSLHLRLPDAPASQEAAFRGIERVLRSLPDVHRQEEITENPIGTILNAARTFSLVVMGATARPGRDPNSLGPVFDQLVQDTTRSHEVVVVKTRRPMPANLESEEAGQTAISVLVDKWFAENTYHADEFDNLEYLLDLKRKQNVTISLALPALNEEETVGNVIGTAKKALMERVPLLDEIILIDSNSTDRTREIAEKLEVPVYIHQKTLPQYGARRGKGEALWKSVYLTRGDIIVWVDTDIANIHPRFIYGLLGPLLLRPDVLFIKGFYRRPLKVGEKLQAGGGGRVTELTARPLINLFYPELSGVVQPLAGEYGGRRSVLEQLPFFSGYGVEIGLLIDTFEKFGLNAIAQVDLKERVHHNQPLEALSKMSFAIIQAVIRKMERRIGRNLLEDVNKTMKLIRHEPGHFYLDVEEIAERERPPMLEVAEYVERRSAKP